MKRSEPASQSPTLHIDKKLKPNEGDPEEDASWTKVEKRKDKKKRKAEAKHDVRTHFYHRHAQKD
jgi:hypothetical protein